MELYFLKQIEQFKQLWDPGVHLRYKKIQKKITNTWILPLKSYVYRFYPSPQKS